MDDPNWLTRLRNDLITLSTNAAREFWHGPRREDPPYYNYRLEHVQQVERVAIRLLQVVGGDRDVVLASVWIHDRFQPQYAGNDHAVRASEWASEYLASYDFPPEKIAAVRFAVASHADPPNTLPVNAHDARLVWDADKLSKIGVINIVTFLCGAPAFPHKPLTFSTLIQHKLEFLGKDLALVERFYFEQSKEWARERFAAQKAFYAALAREAGFDENS